MGKSTTHAISLREFLQADFWTKRERLVLEKSTNHVVSARSHERDGFYANNHMYVCNFISCKGKSLKSLWVVVVSTPLLQLRFLDSLAMKYLAHLLL